MLFSLLTFLFRDPLLNFLGASPDTYGYAESYLNWVVVLGGGKTNDMSSLFGSIQDALDAGAAGVAIGRNVWGHENARELTAALVDMVHNGVKADALQF